MYTLNDIQTPLEELLFTMSSIINTEFAIFDPNAQLIACTDLYEKYKGKSVHSTSIKEVLSQEKVIVNKPGYMESCKGCRFAYNCPSTIEILCCIKVENTTLGVISLTSFSVESQNLILNNTNQYMKLLINTSNIISTLLINEEIKKNEKIMDKIVEKVIDNSTENIVVTNNKGNIMYCNPVVQDWFSFCDLYKKSIHQLFPRNIANWLLDKSPTTKKYVIDKNFSGTLSSIPIAVDEKIVAHIIKMEKSSKTEMAKSKKLHTNFIITSDKKMLNLKEKIIKIANSPSSVLITGETGTGKELFAKAIHYSSNRKDNPFIPINCANIPENLFESELFGYEEGAFTGAKKGGKLGLFEMANGGTLLLDEIGELPLYLQAKLLRVLQDNAIQRLGSLQFIPIDVRIIASTNKNLEEMINENSFREDLYYRLNVIPLKIPPLRERSGDVEILTHYFIEKYSKKLNKNIYSITPEAIAQLTDYHWPGNVRELENAIEYSINMEESKIIQLENLPEKLQNINNSSTNSLAKLESKLIVETIDKYGWDVKGKENAAKELGISLRTLYRKLEK